MHATPYELTTPRNFKLTKPLESLGKTGLDGHYRCLDLTLDDRVSYLTKEVQQKLFSVQRMKITKPPTPLGPFYIFYQNGTTSRNSQFTSRKLVILSCKTFWENNLPTSSKISNISHKAPLFHHVRRSETKNKGWVNNTLQTLPMSNLTPQHSWLLMTRLVNIISRFHLLIQNQGKVMG